MVDRIDEKLIGERAAAFSGEVRSPSPTCQTIASGRKRSRTERRNATSGVSCCPRSIWHGADRCTTERLPMRCSERPDLGRTGRSEWRLRARFENDKWKISGKRKTFGVL